MRGRSFGSSRRSIRARRDHGHSQCKPKVLQEIRWRQTASYLLIRRVFYGCLLGCVRCCCGLCVVFASVATVYISCPLYTKMDKEHAVFSNCSSSQMRTKRSTERYVHELLKTEPKDPHRTEAGRSDSRIRSIVSNSSIQSKRFHEDTQVL